MIAQTETVSSLLAELCYAPQWREYGFLSDDFLHEQVAEYRRGEDTHTEHYRWRAFLAFLDAHDSLTDTQLRQYVELALLDDVLTANAIIQLTAWGNLTDEQLADLQDNAALQRPDVQKRVTRAILLRALRAHEITDTIAATSIASGDREVHAALLSVPGVSYQHLIALSERGANKAIRAAATQLLQSRRPLQ